MTHRLVVRTIEGHYGINGLIEQPFPSFYDTPNAPVKRARVTPTYVLYAEVERKPKTNAD